MPQKPFIMILSQFAQKPFYHDFRPFLLKTPLLRFSDLFVQNTFIAILGSFCSKPLYHGFDPICPENPLSRF